MAYALPPLLFGECHKYCVDVEFKAAETDEQRTCLSNCQKKTYSAFDLYMNVSERVAARRNFRHYVDLSKFTGMEVEHQHDTESVIPHQNDTHINPSSIAPFAKVTRMEMSDVKKKALN